MQKNKEVIFVTSNENKARELSDFLETPLKRVSMRLDEIQSMDLKEVIEHKARQAFSKLKKAIIVEDVGFYIKQWNGFPGPFIKWIQNSIGYEALTKLLLKKDRTVKWEVMYGFFDGKKLQTFSGYILGTVAKKPRGKKGWGFDTIFIPKGYTETYGEMEDGRKAMASARVLALTKLKRSIFS